MEVVYVGGGWQADKIIRQIRRSDEIIFNIELG